jgi:hypothetical protein
VRFIGEHRHDVVDGRVFGVEPICRVLSQHGCQIAPSTYYAARHRGVCARGVRDAELLGRIRTYADDVRRRLLVKPGMTGLWQINGRSDLSWDDAVRLDLYDVENWLVVCDLMILWRTARAVRQASGAY